MTGKADFSQEEWTQLQHGLMGTTLLVSLSDPGLFDTFKEAGAAGRHLAEARRGNESELVRELATSPPGAFGLGKQPQQLEAETLDALRSGMAALRAKAPDEADAYRRFVLEVAQSVAAAAGGVAAGESGAIDKIRGALGEDGGAAA
jgi:hypothetical protein